VLNCAPRHEDEAQLQAFQNSTLRSDVAVQSVWQINHFIRGGRFVGSHHIEERVGPTAGLELVQKRKFPYIGGGWWVGVQIFSTHLTD